MGAIMNVNSSGFRQSIPVQVPREIVVADLRPAMKREARVAREIRCATSALSQSGLSADQVKAASQALEKMSRGQKVLAAADSLDSAVSQIMAEQCKQTSERASVAIGAVKDRLVKIQGNRLKEQAQLERQREAEKKAGFWEKIVCFFKAIAAVFSAASSVFTGPIGIVGAALMVGSIIVSYTVEAQWGKYLSLGLSVAGALVSLGAGLMGEVLKGAGRVVVASFRFVEAGSTAVSGAGTIVRGTYSKESLEAQSNLAAIGAESKKLLLELESEKEVVRVMAEAQNRCLEATRRVLECHRQAGSAATQRRGQ
jgi:hypothetical protein